MQTGTLSRIFGLLLILMSLSFIPPMMVEEIYQDGNVLPFLSSFAGTLGLGLLLWFIFRDSRHELRSYDGFLVVALFWLTASIISALPLYLAFSPDLSLTDALFEAISGITTTGATIFPHLEDLPHSLLYYRQQLQFFGGISIVILAVAILPTLGIGGMQLFKTEMTGPIKNNKVLPRITQSAKAIWFVYLTITLLCTLSYWLAGMSFFDALSHSFSTVSTGGFSTHDQSLAYFNNPYINSIAIFFMLLGAINFNLHFLAFKNISFHSYRDDDECTLFFKIIFLFTIVLWASWILFIPTQHPRTLMIDALFQTTTFLTTTGLSNTALQPWPLFIPMLLLFLGLIGGCAGSTSGGVKIIRILLLQKQASREINRLIHPHGQYVVKLGDMPLSGRIIEAIWGFFAIYFVVFILLFLLLLIAENDLSSAYTALLACLSNTGLVLGAVAQDFASLSDGAKWVLSAAMILGRLEIFTLLVLLSPAFWRR